MSIESALSKEERLKEIIEGTISNLKALLEEPNEEVEEEEIELAGFPDILTAYIIAEYLSLSKRRVYELMDIIPEAGGIPSFKIGSSKRVYKKDFEDWLMSKRGEANNE